MSAENRRRLDRLEDLTVAMEALALDTARAMAEKRGPLAREERLIEPQRPREVTPLPGPVE